MDLAELGDALAAKVREAEEAIYADPDDPLVNWAEDDLRAAFLAANLTEVTVEAVETVAEARISPALLDRWFSPAPAGERPSYGQRLASLLKPDEMAAVEALYRRKLTGATVPWRSVTAYVMARPHKGMVVTTSVVMEEVRNGRSPHRNWPEGRSRSLLPCISAR